MKAIKGLIIKDLLQLKTYKRTLFVFIAIFILTSITQEHTRNILTVMMTLGLGMFSIATFSYDEMAKADKYILTLPLTKKEIVRSKYVLVITATILGAILGMMASAILSLALQKELPNLTEMLELAFGGIFGIGMVEAIQIPCIYKFGAEKGRIQVFIGIAIMAFLLGGIVWLGEKYSVNLLATPVMATLINFLPILLLLLTAIVYFISYRIAYKIYKKKEL